MTSSYRGALILWEPHGQDSGANGETEARRGQGCPGSQSGRGRAGIQPPVLAVPTPHPVQGRVCRDWEGVEKSEPGTCTELGPHQVTLRPPHLGKFISHLPLSVSQMCSALGVSRAAAGKSYKILF